MSFLLRMTAQIDLISLMATCSCCLRDSDGVNHTPKYLTGLWLGDGLTHALSEPIIIPSEGWSSALPLMIISSDFAPLMSISLRMKNSFEMERVFSIDCLDRKIHEVLSKKANA